MVSFAPSECPRSLKLVSTASLGRHPAAKYPIIVGVNQEQRATPSNLSRFHRAELQNLANQLAQLSAGWQIVNDGDAFVGQPRNGEIVVDLRDGTASVNGARRTMGIALHAANWLRAEYLRKPWLAELRPEISLSILYRARSEVAKRVDLSIEAHCRVEALHSRFEAEFANTQGAFMSDG